MRSIHQQNVLGEGKGRRRTPTFQEPGGRSVLPKSQERQEEITAPARDL